MIKHLQKADKSWRKDTWDPISFSLPASSPSGMWPDLDLGFHEIPCILMHNPLAPHPYSPVSQRERISIIYNQEALATRNGVARTRNHGLPVSIQVPQGGQCAEQESQRIFFFFFKSWTLTPHSCLLPNLIWAALVTPLYHAHERHLTNVRRIG